MLENKIIKAITACIPLMLLPPPLHVHANMRVPTHTHTHTHTHTMQGRLLPDIQEHIQFPIMESITKYRLHLLLITAVSFKVDPQLYTMGPEFLTLLECHSPSHGGQSVIVSIINILK